MRYAPQTIPEGGTVNVYVWTDYVCPFCFLGESLVARAIGGLNARMIWMPFELRPYPTPTLRPEDEYLPRVWESSVYPMARRLGVTIHLPTVSPQPYTRKAFIGMQYAMDQGLGNAYTDTVLRAFFQRDLDVGSTEVLKRLATEVGLDPAAYEAALDDPQYAARHDAALELARQFGIQAVPATLVGNKLVSGASDDVEGLRRLIQETRTNLIDLSVQDSLHRP